MTQLLQGQVALVTGATRGIGAAIARALAEAGAHVIGTATTDAGAQTITDHLSQYPASRGVKLNVTQAQDCEQLIDQLIKLEGGLHILVNNAGITQDTLAMRMKDEDWHAVLDTNLHAVFRLSRSAIRPMMKQRMGRIINITSVVGRAGNPGQANYAASKAGVVGMTRALARELGSRGITVNCVSPGFIDTDMTSALSDEQRKAMLAQIPAGVLGQPADVAQAVLYLSQAAYVTGQELHVNGGMWMG